MKKEQLSLENMEIRDNDAKLSFVLSKFNFYLCEKCGNTFHGGLKDCVQAEDFDQLDNVDTVKRLCLDCFDYSKIKGVTKCDIHGRNHIQYKCKFCCEISSHFCWGTTHFCEDCHLKQLKGDYLTKKSKCDLAKCDKLTCPLNGDHPENGEEYGICCSMCLK